MTIPKSSGKTSALNAPNQTERAHAIRVVLFDVGGVLVELTGAPTLLSWLGEPISPDEMWVRWLTSPAVRAFETGRIDPQAFAARLIDELALRVTPERLLREFTYWPSGTFPGALDLVRRVPKRLARATLCNTNVLHWPRLMDEMGLRDLFDRHFASHLTGRIKPDEDAFVHVIESMGCAPDEVLFLDDNRLNVEGAARAGMHAVQVRSVPEAEQALERFGVLAARAPSDARGAGCVDRNRPGGAG